MLSHSVMSDSLDCSPSSSSVHGILSTSILDWAAISSCGSSQPRDWTQVSSVSCIGRWTLYHWATWKPTMRLLISIHLFVFCTKFSEAWREVAFFWVFCRALRVATKKGHIQPKWGAWYFSDFPIRVKMPTKCAWGSSVSVGPGCFPFFLCVQTLNKASKLCFLN